MKTSIETHNAILNSIKAVDDSILSIGLALVRIKTEKLHRDLGYRFMSAYIQHLIDQSGKDRSSIYKWLQIGEVYLKYKNELEKAGFNGNDSPTKLPYLERALAKNPKDEVFDNIKVMTQREFSAFAKAKAGDFAKAKSNISSETVNVQDEISASAAEAGSKSAEGGEDISDFEIISNGFTANDLGHTFFYGKKLAAWVNRSLSRNALRILLPAMRMSFNAIDKKGYVVAVHLDNRREYERFRDIAIEAREQMRTTLGRSTLTRNDRTR